MNLREVEFLNKFWSIRLGGTKVVREFFLILINRRIESLTRFLREQQNIPQVQISFCQRTLNGIRSVERSFKINEPVNGCPEAGCNTCLASYIEQYKTFVTSCYQRVFCYYYYHGVSDDETTRTLMLKMTNSTSISPHTRDIAVNLTKPYIDYLQHLYQIIEKLTSSGHHIGLNRQSIQASIVELQWIRTGLESAAFPITLASPEARNKSSFYNSMIRFHFLIEASAWEFGI